jgi:hypothetical protein
MRIEQITTSRMVADEGKVFVRKSDGYIMGDTISLGYDYYDAGLPNSAPHATTPDDYEEIDTPENWQERSVIRPVQMLKRATEICNQYTSEMNSLELSASEALAVQNWYPTLYETEGFKDGDMIAMNTKFQYNGKLWAARQSVVISEVYPPSIDTAALYVEVTEDYVDGVEQGTLENPIDYDGNMALEEGKYYRQNEVVYLCTRDTGNPVYHALKDLVGLYVEVA